MKKPLLLFTACILSTLSFAQGARTNQKAMQFGLKAGVHFSNMNFNKGVPPPAAAVEASWKPGFVLGGSLTAVIHNQLSFQPEYLYLQTNGEHKTTGAQYSMSYVSLPVLLKYSIVPRLSILAGPQFDLMIKANEKVNGIHKNITHDTEERSIYAVGGLEFNLINTLSLNARYLHGFNHIGIGQRSAVTEFKYEAVQITAGIKF